MNRINAVHREAVINKMVDLTHQCWVRDHLKAKTPKDGSISLHLASGNSILPYCEALYGVKVIVTDIESFGIDLSMKNFLKGT